MDGTLGQAKTDLVGCCVFRSNQPGEQLKLLAAAPHTGEILAFDFPTNVADDAFMDRDVPQLSHTVHARSGGVPTDCIEDSSTGHLYICDVAKKAVMVQRQKGELDAILRLLDRDQSGFVEYREVVALMTKYHKNACKDDPFINELVDSASENVREALDRLAEEIYHRQGEFLKVINRIDKNKDGHLDSDEIKKALKQLGVHLDTGEVEVCVDEYRGKALRGPIAIAHVTTIPGLFYFTDAGPLGETSLADPTGSLFQLDTRAHLLEPLAYETLAYPWGVAASADGRCVFVGETNRNRIIRFAKNAEGAWLQSVFFQFAGGFGPSALAFDFHQRLWCCRFDFHVPNRPSGNGGSLVVLEANGGAVVSTRSLPFSEVVGIAISGTRTTQIVYITERTSKSIFWISM